MTTVLRDTRRAQRGRRGLKLRDGAGGGDVDLRNVTVTADDGVGDPVRDERGDDVVNVVARGAHGDVDAGTTGARSARSSNFRPASRPASARRARTSPPTRSSPTPRPATSILQPGTHAVDAGNDRRAARPAQPRRRAAPLGAAPATSAPPGGRPPVHRARPGRLGRRARSAAADPRRRTTRPRPRPRRPRTRPAADPPAARRRQARRRAPRRAGPCSSPAPEGFVPLSAGTTVPVGALVDTRRGTVLLQSARRYARRHADRHLPRRGVRRPPDHRAAPDDRARPRAAATSPPARPAHPAPRARPRRPRAEVVRRLWGGTAAARFRTRGRAAVGDGARHGWLTEDCCEGTRVTVSGAPSMCGRTAVATPGASAPAAPSSSAVASLAQSRSRRICSRSASRFARRSCASRSRRSRVVSCTRARGTSRGPAVVVERDHRQVGGVRVADVAGARVLGLDAHADLHRRAPRGVDRRAEGERPRRRGPARGTSCGPWPAVTTRPPECRTAASPAASSA